MGMAGGFLLVGAAMVGLILVAGKGASALAGTGAPAGAVTPGPDSAGMAADRNYLMGQGLTRTAAAGIVGNLWQESSGDPHAPGGGLAQWIGSRWQALTAFAAQHGLDPQSNGAQLAFLVNELHTGYPQLVGQLNGAATPAEAATLFSNVYERPGNPQLQNRVNYAQQAFAA